MAETRLVREIGREAALRLVVAGQAAAGREGLAIAVAVVDRGGHVILLDRMDGAASCTVTLALAKAETAAATLAPTATWFTSTQPGQPDWGMHTALGGRFNAMPGGLPITLDGEIVGALGVSGGEATQDVACAEAALAGLAGIR